MIDRLGMRDRPPGLPIMLQTWDKLLFMHWPIPAALLRPLIPPRLAIDTFEGTAWIAITPLTIRGLRPPFLPPAPLVSQTLEINVRSYVHLDGAPGVWFFSLDASNPLAVWGARLGYALPYFRAAMKWEERDETFACISHRTHSSAALAELDAAWTHGAPLPEARPETLDFFLIERYCLYAARGDHLYRARIHHRPWPLRRATLSRLHSTMIEAHGLPTPGQPPLLHAQAAPLQVQVWPPQRV